MTYNTLPPHLSQQDKERVDATVKRLLKVKFTIDPIIGNIFSVIASRVGSMAKRHGPLIDACLIDALNSYDHYQAWSDKCFFHSKQVESTFTSLGEKCVKVDDVEYETSGRKRQNDLFVYNKSTKHLAAYEIKRGHGKHDDNKRHSMLRDLCCTRMLLKSYGRKRGLDVESVSSLVIFYYGVVSLPDKYSKYSLKGDQLDAHFGVSVQARIEAMNSYYSQQGNQTLAIKS